MAVDPLASFKGMISELMSDKTPRVVSLSVADMEVIMSMCLDYAAQADMPDETADSLINLARGFSYIIETHHPTVEPYLAFIFGAVVFRRADVD